MMNKDANELLQAFNQKHVDADQQRDLIQQAMSEAPTMVEAAAAWAGTQSGARHDQAVEVVFRLIKTMPDVLQAKYRKKLAKNMGLGMTEYNAIQKTVSKKEKVDGDGEAVYTLGGCIDGWLVDYVYDPATDQSRLAYRSPDGEVGIKDQLMVEGIKYLPKAPNSFQVPRWQPADYH